MGDMSFCLLPDFVGCAMVVSLPVGVVGILVGIKIFVRLTSVDFASRSNRSVRAVARIGVDNVGAIGMQDALALRRNVLRHTQRDRKAFGGSDHRVGDSGVSAGGVEQSLV